MRDSFFAWAEGYMSGLNDKYLGTKAATNLLPPNESTDAQKQFLSDFCARHPEISYMAAVEALFVAMRRQQGLAK